MTTTFQLFLIYELFLCEEKLNDKVSKLYFYFKIASIILKYYFKTRF